ncbi:MAG: HEAT repeat domain-containing protein [Candidatus Thiodiazotropha sp.]
MSHTDAPGALLLLSSGCPHCPAVLQNLSQLLKQGRIGRLEAVNIAEHPETAQEIGTRTVPWTRIGRFELEGLVSLGELETWIDMTFREEGAAYYLSHLLKTQHAPQAAIWIERNPDTVADLIGLLESPDTPIVVRIGVGVVAEELQGSSVWQSALNHLDRLARSADAALRADAAHYLGLTHSSAALESLQRMLEDENPDVREIASDSLALLDEKMTND